METILKVTALMTTPRQELVLSRNWIEIALKKAGIPLVVSGGVFYGQCMQRMLQDAIDSGADIALTIDSDSLFTAEDINRLLQNLVERDEIDAIAALQCRRGKRFPLMTTGDGKTTHEITGQPFKVRTAHFGLTAIDLHRLRDVPKPWFWSKPDANGDWSEDKIDDDIWFWQQWGDSGRSLYIDPKTSIGHVEEMVSVFDANLQPVHIYPGDWADQAYPPKTKTGVLVYVGANVGGCAVEKLCDTHQASYLFEPFSKAADVLRRTVGKKPGVEIVQMACGEANGPSATLHIYNDLGQSSSLGWVTEQAIREYSTFDLSEQGREKVEICNLGEWLSARSIDSIRTLIIDAQGMDLTILKTLEPRLEAGLIESIQCEADAEGFTHYHGVPDNSESNFQKFMEQFPHYIPSRQPDRVAIQPDLTWTLNRELLCQTV